MLQNFLVKLCTFHLRVKVGEDVYGNQYYQSKKPWMYKESIKKERRWVIYKKNIDPTLIPAQWYGWLHYMIDNPPKILISLQPTWYKNVKPNMTGSQDAYFPQPAKRQSYKAWTPEKK